MGQGDYYILLGVRRTAKKTELQRAFRRLSRKYHPDINPGDRAAELHYRRVCEAFEVLSSPEERERYDRYGRQPDIEPDTPEEGYGFEGFDFTLSGNKDADIFPDIFRRSGRTDRPGAGGRGEDLQHTLSISFEESLAGVAASFRVNRLVSCGTCEGWGEISSDRQETCEACKGSGRSTQSRGFMLFAKPCTECGGSGIWDRQPCPDCRGAGRLSRMEDVAVAAPPGVDDGYRIVVPGKGSDGRGGGRSGDLHVQIHVADHPLFTRKGDNLFCTVPISFTEAALGCRVKVPTIGGTVKVRVPAGVQSGQKLRLSERGAPSIRGDGRGDLFVLVQVVTPVVHDHRSREILKELADLHPENPREGRWPGEPTAEGQANK